MNTMESIKAVLVLVVLAAASWACDTGDIISQQEPSTSGDIIFFDDFSDPESGWERNSEGVVKEYYQGIYHIMVESSNYFSWSLAHQSLGDVRVKVDLAYIGPADLAEMGIICRLQDNNNFYFFTIRSDGGFAILKRQGGNEYFIGTDGYTTSTAINQGVATNLIEAECAGPNLSLYANGQHLMTVNDASFQLGDVGLIVGAFDQPDVNVYFDNFEVIQP